MQHIALPALIVGSNSQIGQSLLRRWRLDATRDEPIIALARARESLDVTDREQVLSTIVGCRPAVVINCAGYTNVAMAETEPQQCWLTNALGVQHLSEACARVDAALVQLSTDFVFSHPQAVNLNPGAVGPGFDEDALPAASGEYALSKLTSEFRLHEIGHTAGLKYWIIRTSGLFEPPWRSARNFLFAMASRLYESRGEISVVDDVTTTICSSDYLAEVIDWIVTEQVFRHADSAVYHVAQAGSATWFAIAQHLALNLGLSSKRIVAVDRERYARSSGRLLSTLPKYTPLACRKLQSDSGLSPVLWRKAVEEWAALAREYF